MRICHISDTHGEFPILNNKFDVIVHSGDFFPNSPAILFGSSGQEAEFQKDWLTKRIPDLKDMVGNYPFLFTLGNHDFLSSEIVEQLLQQAGIKAFSLNNKHVTIDSINLYGFPYIPYISGKWNYELMLPEMQIQVDKMTEQLNSVQTHVLVCHAPIYKTLDLAFSNNNFGSTVIANMLDYSISQNKMPVAYLHGHIHEAAGISIRNNLLVSNAATTQQIICLPDIPKDRAQRLKDLGFEDLTPDQLANIQLGRNLI